MRFWNRSVLWMIAVLTVLATASFVFAAVSSADIARIKAKVEAGEMLSQADIRLAEEINATTGSHIDIDQALTRAKMVREGHEESAQRPRNPLDEYVWNPTTYDWVDISANGTDTGLNGDDQNLGPFNLGFNFNFYGTSYSSIRVCSNGWLSPTDGSTTYTNTAIPAAGTPNNAIYGWWDDLTASGGTVKYLADAANNRFIVSYNVRRLAETTPQFQFQVILYANGDIKMQYESLPTATNSCTIGIENADASQALQACFDGAGTVPTAGSAFIINQPNGVPLPPTNLAAALNGSNVVLTWADPTHDTNGNTLTPDSIQVFLDAAMTTQIGSIFHGIQTFTHVNAPSGNLTYYVRARSTQYFSAPASVTILVGNASYSEDFEASDGMWVSDGGWTWGTPTNPNAPAPHSGTNLWGVGFDANYPVSACNNLDLNLGLNVTTVTASIEFWMWYQCEGYFDGTNFQVSVDEGATWTVVEPETPYNEDATSTSNACIPGQRAWSISTGGNTWQHYVVPLGDFNGQTPIFRFSFGSDGSVAGVGFFIDDMTIWGLGVPVTYPVSGHVTLDGGLGDVTQVLVRANGVGNPTTHPLANGNFTLPNVQSGNRILTATLANYVTTTLPLTVNGPVTNANITARREPPAPPVLDSVIVNSTTGLATLYWTNNDATVDRYKVFRKSRDVADWTLMSTVNGGAIHTTTDQITVAGVWQYVVTAVDVDLTPPAIESGYSNMIQVVWGALPPVGLIADGQHDTFIRLSWRVPGSSPETEIFYDNGTNSPGIDGIGFWNNQPPFGWLVSHYQTNSGPATITRLKNYLTGFATLGDNTQVGIFEDDGTGMPVLEPIGVLDATVDVQDDWQEFELASPITVGSGSFFVGIRQMTPNAICLGGDEESTFINGTFFYNYAGTTWASYEPGLMAIPMQRAFVIGDFGVVSELSPSPVQTPRIARSQDVAAKSAWAAAISKTTGVKKNGKIIDVLPSISSRPLSREHANLMADRRINHSAAPHAPYMMAAASSRNRTTLDNVVYYKVYRGTTRTNLTDLHHVMGENTLTYDDPVAEGINYFYAVSAYYDNNQESVTTDTTSAAAAMAPGAPTNVTNVGVGVTQLRLNWTDPTVNADGTPLVDLANLRIYRDGVLIGTVAPGVQTFLTTPPENDVNYTYNIRGIDEVPNEGPSGVTIGAPLAPWSPVDYEWVDITDVGTPGPTGDDANMTGIDLGFDFEYYDNTYNTINICTNGWVSFSSTVANYVNGAIPSADEPNCAVYGFWDDLIAQDGQILYYADAANSRFIITYNLPHLGGGGTETFQIIIDAGGSITVNYQTVSNAASCTIGVENCDGTAAHQLYFNGAGPWTPTNESAVAYFRGPDIRATVSGHVTMDGGSGTAPQVLISCNGMDHPTVHPAANGDFTMNNVQVGNRRLTATLDGYHTAVFSFVLPETGYTGANLTMRRVNPPAPTNLVGVVNSSTGNCVLTWTISPDLLVDGYKIYRRLQGETTWNLLTTVNGRTTVTYTDLLTVAGIYQYVITAFDSGVTPPAVESDYSNQIQVLFGAIPPVMLTANGNFDNKIQLSWLAPGTPPEIEVFYDNGANSPGIDGIGFWNNQPPFGWLVSHYQGNGPITITRLKNYLTGFATLGDNTQVGIFEDDGTGMPVMEPTGVLDATVDVQDDWQEFTLDPAVTVASGSFFVGIRQMTANAICLGGDEETPFMNGTFFYNFNGTAWATYEPGLMAIPLQRAFVIGDMGGDLAEVELTPSPVKGPVASKIGSTPKGLAMTKGTATVSKSASSSKAKIMLTEQSALTSGRGFNRDSWLNRSRLMSAVAPHAPHMMASGRTSRDHNTLDEVIRYLIYRDTYTTVIDSVAGTVLTYANQPLPENTPHTYWVRARYDNNALSDTTNRATARPNMAPAAITNLDGVSNGSTTITLSWTNPTTNADNTPCVDLAGVKVYRDGEYLATVTAPTATYNDVPPATDQYYTYTVRGIDEVPNEAAVSNTVIKSVISPWEVVDYEWIDITSTGTPCATGDDVMEGPFDLGFAFEFMGNTYTSLNVCSNGFVTFTGQTPTFFNTCIPTAEEPNDALYGFWDDMNSGAGGQILYYADAANQRFIISWEGVFHFGTTDPYTFQIVLGADNSVRFNYQSLVDISSATVGVENLDGTSAIQLICNGGEVMWSPENNASVSFWGGPSGRLEGQVRTFGTNPQPISGVSVYAILGADSILGMTDAAGNYAIRCEPGTYSVYMNHPIHCDTLYANVVVENGATTTRNGTLKTTADPEFDRTSMNIQTHQNQATGQSFHITVPATGQCPLDFSITQTGLPWLTVGPRTGSIAPGTSWEIWVTATPNVAPGDYNTTLNIAFNEATTPYSLRVDVNVLNVEPVGGALPTIFAMHQNYPNPFNPTTVLPFDVPMQSHVEIVLYNVMGQEVLRPVSGDFAAGRYKATIDAGNLPSGMYLVKMNAGDFSAMSKMMLLK